MSVIGWRRGQPHSQNPDNIRHPIEERMKSIRLHAQGPRQEPIGELGQGHQYVEGKHPPQDSPNVVGASHG